MDNLLMKRKTRQIAHKGDPLGTISFCLPKRQLTDEPIGQEDSLSSLKNWTGGKKGKYLSPDGNRSKNKDHSKHAMSIL
jgi:hypothetical protein